MKSHPFRLALTTAVFSAGCAAPPATSPQPPTAPLVLEGKMNTEAPTANQPLKVSPVLQDLHPDPNIVEVDLFASEEEIRVFDGPPTRMMVFNGMFPGPTLQAKEGDTVIVHFHNRLSAPTTVHFHGMVIHPEHDGGPWNLVSPRQSHTYTWKARAGMPMTAWYHAHPHGLTHLQVPKGMAGALEILDPNDPLPVSYGDTPLLLTDQKFDLNNQILPDTEFDRFNGREGDRVFVNGQLTPRLKLQPGEIRRLRLINVSPARFYKVGIPGMNLIHVGTDGGLFGTPAVVPNVLLSTAERAEVLVQAPRQAGTFTLTAFAHDRGMGLRENFDRPLMTIEVGGAPVNPPPVPATLRTVTPISTVGAGERTFQTGVVRSAATGMLHFALNQERYDPLRITPVPAQLGTTEVITIDNTGSADHPIHLHNVQFQVLDAAGVPIPRWKDVVIAPRGVKTKFVVRYGADEFPGLFMLHCHILQHEDDGMMTDIVVNPAAP